MRTIIGSIFILIALSIAITSCGGETYADKLKREEKSINRFIDAQDIKLIYTYPDDHEFGENEYFFYKDAATVVYIHVISPGDTKAVPSKERRDPVQIIFDEVIDLNEGDTLWYTNQYSDLMDFAYGDENTYQGTASNVSTVGGYYYQLYYFMSRALAVPLDYGLGHNAEVKLIVPFAGGSAYQKYDYKPFYYARVKYNIIVPVPEE